MTYTNSYKEELWMGSVRMGDVSFKSIGYITIIQKGYVIYVYIRVSCKHLGAVSIRKTVLPGMAIPMLKIRRPNGRLIFNMEIAIRR